MLLRAASFLGWPINWKYALPAFAAAAVALANLAAVALFLPESLSPELRRELADRPRDEFTLRNLGRAFGQEAVGPLLTTRLFYSVSFSLMTTMFALYSLLRFGLEQDETAYILAYVGLIAAVVQGGLIGWLTSKFDERRLLFGCMALMAAS